MITLTEDNIVPYLRDLGVLPEGKELPRVTTLGGGVSNVVLRVTQNDLDIVIKQALPRLNVEEEWLATVDRVDIEVECLKLLSEGLPAGSVPDFVYYDPDNYSYGMTMMPDRFRMWKSELLESQIRPPVARSVGDMLGAIHGMTWNRAGIGPKFDDVEAFIQLRIDAYYRTTRSRHPDEAAFFTEAIDMALKCRHSLVHGDFSPKNILVDKSGQVVLLDYEVAHYGDPAFDAAFLINHLVLKAIHLPAVSKQLCEAVRAFWQGYTETLKRAIASIPADLESRVVTHLGCMQLARVDGKSPAEYIVQEEEKEAIRGFAKKLLHDGVRSLNGVLSLIDTVNDKVRLRNG